MPAVKVEMLALALARGESVADAAQALGVNERTAYRWAAEPGFKARVDELRRSMVQDAVGRLSDAACEAVDTLRGLLTSGPPTVRCSAARTILDKLIDVQAHAELNERVAELERWMHEREAGQADSEA